MMICLQLSRLQEAENYVLYMTEGDEIFTSIHQKARMVSFHNSPEKHKPAMLHIDHEYSYQ